MLTETRERVGYIILNRPEKRNALSAELVEALKEKISFFLNDKSIKVIVLKSREGAFCAGADLAYLTSLRSNTYDENVQDSQNLRALFDLIYQGSKVFVAQVEGPAIAGGCGLASVCDFCFATSEATFGYTESRIGFVPALVMIYLNKKLQGSTVRDLFITGEIITASKAKAIGLVKEIYEQEEITERVDEFAQKLCKTVSGASLTLIKEMLVKTEDMNINEALDYAAHINAKARATEDCKRGMDAFLNKEKLVW